MLKFISLILLCFSATSFSDTIQSYEPHANLVELGTFTFQPEQFRTHVQKFSFDGRNFEIDNPRFSRTSDEFYTTFSFYLKIYDLDEEERRREEALQNTPPGELVGITRKPHRFGLRFLSPVGEIPEILTCGSQLGCWQEQFLLKTWDVPLSENQQQFFQRIVKTQYVHLKSIDYDFLTGSWKDLVVTITEHTERIPHNIPNGGITIGN